MGTSILPALTVKIGIDISGIPLYKPTGTSPYLPNDAAVGEAGTTLCKTSDFIETVLPNPACACKLLAPKSERLRHIAPKPKKADEVIVSRIQLQILKKRTKWLWPSQTMAYNSSHLINKTAVKWSVGVIAATQFNWKQYYKNVPNFKICFFQSLSTLKNDTNLELNIKDCRIKLFKE